jgi:hypothetical protein
MQRHHGSLAEADKRHRARRQVASLQLIVEEAVEHRRSLVDAGPALVGLAEGEGKPFTTHRGLPTRVGRMRRHKGGMREQVLPYTADLDQIVAVRAVTVEENDELAGGSARARLYPGTVELCSQICLLEWVSSLGG